MVNHRHGFQVRFSLKPYGIGLAGFGEAARVAQGRANERRELFRVTLRSVGDAVIPTDTKGYITYLSEVAESLTGWPQQEALGQPLELYLKSSTKDGGECPIDDSAAPIRNEEGYVSGCVLIIRDVTAQRLIEQSKAEQLLTARLLASIVETSIALTGWGQ